MSSASSMFSYAQAAKGETAPGVSPDEDAHTSTQITGHGSERDARTTDGEVKPKAGPESGQVSAGTSNEKEASHARADAHTDSENVVDTIPHEPTQEKSLSAASPTPSSNVAIHSIKEGNVSGNHVHAGSISEKSFEDLSLGKLPEKPETDDNDAKLSIYEQVKPQMKEALPPPVNIWQKRMEDAQAKVAPKPISGTVKTEQAGQAPDRDTGSKPTVSKAPTSTTLSTAAKLKADLGPKSASATTVSDNDVQPPPTSDTTSWPTPDSAKLEEKKTVTERPEQTEKPPVRPHGKEKWEKVAFVPTAVFNTPIPTRGVARGGRIGGRRGRDNTPRGGLASATASSGERLSSATEIDNHTPAGNTTERFKPRESTNNRGGFASKSKRSSSTSLPTSKEFAPANDTHFEKRENLSQRGGTSLQSNDARQISNPTQGENLDQGGPATVSDSQRQISVPSETNGEPRIPRTYQPRPREFGTEQSGYGPPRDRGEGRPERGGRGGWRGKSNAQSHNGYIPASHYQQSLANSKPYSEQRHNPHAAPFSTRESRHSRTSSRSQSIPNNQGYGRFGSSNIGPNGLPILQTDVANAMPFAQQPTIMSAVPFQPYMEQIQLPAMVQMQFEYYFSVDNLCRDMYLRKKMDSQGFVPLHLLASFNRIQSLTTDLNLLKWICARSSEVEIRTNYEGYDLVRKAEDWQQWVLPIEERDSLARNEGPGQLFSPRFEGYPPMLNGFETQPTMSHSTPMSPANSFTMNGFRSEMFSTDGNGHRGAFNQHSAIQTPLSANVPDFKPNGVGPRQEERFDSSEPEQKFGNKDMNILRIMVGADLPKTVSEQTSFQEATVNGVSGHEQSKENAPPKTNGVDAGDLKVNGHAQEHEVQPNSTNEQTTPPHQITTGVSQPRITWTTSTEDINRGESYVSFRTRARQQQNNAAPGNCSPAMQDLYEFWSAFLPNNFNSQMYQDFHSTALEDANLKQSLNGLKALVGFYRISLQSDTTLSDRLLNDFVALALVELGNEHLPRERPAMAQLRNVWKNGKTSTINQINLMKKIDEPLKSALSQGTNAP